jgi:hypothetical protein
MDDAYLKETGIGAQKTCLSWVKNASKIYIYTKANTPVAEVPITHGTTVDDVRRYLWEQEEITDDSSYTRFALSPILKDWYFFGYFDKKSDTRITGKIKAHMNLHNTHSFWMNPKPRKMRDASDSD